MGLRLYREYLNSPTLIGYENEFPIALFLYTLIGVLTTASYNLCIYLFSGTQYINKLYASYLREKAYLTTYQKHWEEKIKK